MMYPTEQYMWIWLLMDFYSGLQAFEMMAIAAVGNNLITYVFSEMHFPLSKSANIVTNFIGTVFLLSLLGGFLSDSYLGSFCTMLIFGFVELTVILSHTPYIYTYMYFVALLQGRTLNILGPSVFSTKYDEFFSKISRVTLVCFYQIVRLLENQYRIFPL